MLSSADEHDLERFLTNLVKKNIPIMAHNAHGLVADSILVTVLNSIQKSARQALHHFVQQRNTLLAVNRLPTEILLHIGSCLPYGSLDSALRVCHHWNQILSSQPSLWDDVTIAFEHNDGAWKDTLQTALERSQTRTKKLAILYKSNGCSPEHCVYLPPLVASTMQSLVELQLDLDGCFCVSWNVVLSTAAPNLDSLSLTGPKEPGAFRLPDNLFGGIAPKLRVVWLTRLLLPTNPGPALDNVSEIAYFDVPYVPSDEVVHICRSCPNMIYLTVTAQSFDDVMPPPEFVPPSLRSICLPGVVPGGTWETIVRATTTKTELRILQPNLALASLVFTRIRHVTEIHIFREFSDSQFVTVMATGDDEYTVCAEDCTLEAAVDMLLAGRDRLAEIAAVTVSDTVFVVLQAADALRGFVGMKSLTLLFDTEAHVPLPHMFTGHGLDAGAPFACAGATIDTVRLASYSQYSHGFKRHYNEVPLPTDLVARWLPKSTTKLYLCGVRLDGARSRIDCPIVQEYKSKGRHGQGVWMEASWQDWFPSHKALHV